MRQRLRPAGRAALLADVAWQRTLQKFIALYKERRDAMRRPSTSSFPRGHLTHPAGGMFLWTTLPDYMDTDSMLAEALESGVTNMCRGNSISSPDGKTGRNSMRVNFSFETPESITEAIRRLAKVIEERLELYRVFIEAGALPGYDRKDAAMDENATSWKDVIVDSSRTRKRSCRPPRRRCRADRDRRGEGDRGAGSHRQNKGRPRGEFQQQRRRV